MKFYNFETRFRSLRDALREYLHKNFEIKTDPAGAEKINRFIDSVSIVEVTQ